MKKQIALALAAAMSVGMLAGCGGGAASSTAGAASEAASTGSSGGSGSLTISWWGGDSRHAAYQEAIKAFTEETGITVEPSYGAWSGWEEAKSTALAAGQGEDVMQVNWNWLYQYSGEGQSFADLNEFADIIDLSQFPQSALDACTVAGELQAIPVAMTGRTFYWNMNTYKAAGIETAPTSYEELIAAGKAFQEKLGDEYYPLCVGPYDRMIMMTFWL